MKAFVRDGKWYFTTVYYHNTDPKGNIRTKITGVEINLLKLVLEQMNMSISRVPLAKVYEIQLNPIDIIGAMLSKKVYMV